MRGFGSSCAILLVLAAFAGAARAADPALPSDPIASDQIAAADPGAATSGDDIRAVVTGLRQSVVDNGLSEAFNRASDWVKELELSWTAHRSASAALGIDTEADANTDSETDTDRPSATAALAARTAGLASPTRSLGLGLFSFGAGGAESQVWALGHAQPLTSLAVTGNDPDRAIDPTSSATDGAALANRDVELGLRVPMLPWSATLAGEHYWWGVRGFGQQVEGSRVALKLSPAENIEIEGGRAQDTRGSGGFVGVLYRVPLDQPK